MLREHEQIGKCFHSFIEFSQAYTSVNVSIDLTETWRTCFLFVFRKFRDDKKENYLFALIIKM